MKLRPCDCKDQATADMLNEQSIGHNAFSLTVQPSVVVIRRQGVMVEIPMIFFKMFAEWYLKEQEIEEK